MNFTKDGKITGFSTEVLEAVLKEIGVTGNIKVQPWARAMNTAQVEPNVLIYSIGRNEQRESLFKWVGQINDQRNFLYALKGSAIKLSSLDDAKAYRVGTVNGDLREQYLEKKGFVVGKNLDRINKHDANFDKLKAGRIDVWPMSEAVAAHIVREKGEKPSDVLVPVLELKDVTSYTGSFMAFGLKTPDDVVEKFRAGLEKVKKNGTYAAIAKKWL